jgi:hypothetical protein
MAHFCTCLICTRLVLTRETFSVVEILEFVAALPASNVSSR